MALRTGVFVALISWCLLIGCSVKRDLIVLLPDPDGKVGVIRVTTKGGAQILDKSAYGVQVEGFDKPPMAPKSIAEGEITDVFGRALSAQPDLRGRFISFLLFFETDTTELTRESKEMFPEIVRTIQNRKPNEIYVIGHTDRVGTELYNLKLSSRRAYYIRDLLVSSGIKAIDVYVSFHGEAMPLVYTEDEVAEPRNRRVEVIAK